ncbi:MAG: class I SAM-dependent methyltransferase [Deferribacterales bacterium]
MPEKTGRNYDKIAHWWQEQHRDSQYGISALKKTLAMCGGNKALDIGCGAGGRFIHAMQAAGFAVTGVDISAKMIELAKENHPEHTFFHDDICKWQSDIKFDLITAWDSIFHLPLNMHESVIDKLCGLLKPEGVLMYTFGDAVGEHTDTWHDEQYYYSSIGIEGNLNLLMKCGVTPVHLELDQYPQTHVCVIAVKRNV